MADLLAFPEPVPASTPRKISDDDAERERALNVEDSWIVEAPAGSGKTGLMIQRYLKLLAHESVDDPGQVLAITFTRKATFELRDRVMAQLEGAANSTIAEGFDAITRPIAEAVLTRDRERGWKLREQPLRLNIRTIDSVCSEIAGSLPVLSRSGGGMSPSEDAERLYAEAARRTTSALGGSDSLLTESLECVLLHRDGNLRECETLIAKMLAWRDQWGELIPLAQAELDDAHLDEVVLPKLERALDLVICSALTRVVKTLPPDMLRELCTLAAEMGKLDGHAGDPSPIALCAGKFTPPEEKAAHLDHWRALIDLLLTKDGSFRKSAGIRSNHLKFMIEATHRNQLGDLIDRVRNNEDLRACLCEVRTLPPARYPAEQWVVAKALFRVLSRALVELQIVFAERGECDFVEVGLLARAALRHEGALDALRISAGHSLQHLLVDEMQDTSSSQYELIELLTQGWDGHSQTVFLVGDPKQSIYLFRQARVERFVRTLQQEQLGDVPLGVLHLSANFRSQANLVRDFNIDFTQIFPATADPSRPELVTYMRAEAVKAATATAAREWHTAILPNSRTEEGRTFRQRQRRHFASTIRTLVERWNALQIQDKPPRMAVLVRSRQHLLEIVQAFKDSRFGPPIPFRAVEVEALGERQEVLDLVALTRALLHPADRVAWLALLRSPFCGLTLVDLHCLTGADDDALRESTVLDLIAQRGDLLSDDGVARLQPFWSILSVALAERGRLRLSQWVDRTFRAFSGYFFSSEEARSNIAQFLNLLDDLEAPGGTLELARLNARLAHLHAAPCVHPGAVDLMTIHGSKGLEWDVVFVPALERIGQTSHGRLLTWLELDADPEHEDDTIAHGILAPIQSKGTESQALNRWMRSLESRREAAERQRLFYVACTRAREELHLFAAPERSAKGELSISPGSMLAAAWPAARAIFEGGRTDNVVTLATAAEPVLLDQLAAEQQMGTQTARTIQRIPLLHLPSGTMQPSSPERVSPAYDRPEGSFAARAFGNVVHAFLEQSAARLASGIAAEDLLAELPHWEARIAAVVRANGLPAKEVARQTAGVLQALGKTLVDPQGRWILASHPRAASESALIAWRSERTSLRLDRTFLAGSEPLSSGSTHLWIVDFKTSTHGRGGLPEFLADHRNTSAPQLEFYAKQLATEGTPVRLALYYPHLSALDWWAPAELC